MKNPLYLQGHAASCDALQLKEMGDEGLEPTANSSKNNAILPTGGAKSGALDVPADGVDSELQSIINAWPTLPEPTKAGILAMVNAQS